MPGDEPLFENQLNDLYDALTKNDIAGGLELLRQIGDSRNTLALQPLLILLEFPDEQVRRCAAVALGKIGDASAVQPLIKALKDSAAAVQEDAAYALGAIGDERATGPLNNVPPDDPRVKKAAEYALVQIRRKSKSYSLFSPQGTAGGFVTGKPAQPVASDRGNGHRTRLTQPPEKQAPAAEAAPVLQKAEASTYGQPEARPLKVVSKDSTGAPRKSELLAAFASFLIPGLGQVYNGEKWTKALLYLIGFCVGTVLLVVPGLIVWLYGIYNAYRTAKKVNAGELSFKKTETGTLILYVIIAFFVAIVFM
ncbi:MAG TPA: HEAT repeat domain-containing protein, partial [Methanocella sp.]|nr:HEAT repeat domain-containing protein [Methanocella sp.]